MRANACSFPRAIRVSGSIEATSLLRKAPQGFLEIRFEKRERCPSCDWTKMDHDIERAKRSTTLPPPIYFSDLPLEAMPDHRSTHLPGRGDPQSGQNGSVRREMQNEHLSVTAAPLSVTPLEIRTTTEPLLSGKAFSQEDSQTVRR